MLLLDVADCGGAGKRLDAPETGANARLALNDEEADRAGGRHMGAAAELIAHVIDADDAHGFAIFFAKERLGAGGNRFRRFQVLSFQLQIRPDVSVHAAFDFLDLLTREGLGMGKVKAQVVRRNQRT